MKVMAKMGYTNNMSINNGNGHDTYSKDGMQKQAGQ